MSKRRMKNDHHSIKNTNYSEYIATLQTTPLTKHRLTLFQSVNHIKTLYSIANTSPLLHPYTKETYRQNASIPNERTQNSIPTTLHRYRFHLNFPQLNDYPLQDEPHNFHRYGEWIWFMSTPLVLKPLVLGLSDVFTAICEIIHPLSGALVPVLQVCKDDACCGNASILALCSNYNWLQSQLGFGELCYSCFIGIGVPGCSLVWLLWQNRIPEFLPKTQFAVLCCQLCPCILTTLVTKLFDNIQYFAMHIYSRDSIGIDKRLRTRSGSCLMDGHCWGAILNSSFLF